MCNSENSEDFWEFVCTPSALVSIFRPSWAALAFSAGGRRESQGVARSRTRATWTRGLSLCRTEESALACDVSCTEFFTSEVLYARNA